MKIRWTPITQTPAQTVFRFPSELKLLGWYCNNKKWLFLIICIEVCAFYPLVDPITYRFNLLLGAWKTEGGEKDGKEASKREKACKKWTILL